MQASIIGIGRCFMRINPSDKFYIQSINRALSLVELIGKSGDEGISLTNLSKASGMAVSTVYRILCNLLSWQYVQEDENGRFRLGFELIALGNAASSSIELKSTAHPYLVELGNQTSETIYLAVLDEERADVMYIDKIESKGNIKLAAGIGSRNCIHSTANGKALVSGFTDDYIRKLISISGMPALTESTITNPEDLIKEINQVRLHGYAIDNIENEPGVRCVAAPIFDSRSRIAGSISLSGISTSVTIELVEQKYKALIMQTAHDISRKMGYRE
jgi:IclR family KDG regulon transcriptional repressor